jgi:hypothetical protein
MSQFLETPLGDDAGVGSPGAPSPRTASFLKFDRNSTPTPQIWDENAERNRFLHPNLDCSACDPPSLLSVDLTTPVPIDQHKSLDFETSTDEVHVGASESSDFTSSTEASCNNELNDSSSKRRLDEEESVRLAMALMEEETRELEERQREFMMNNVTDISPEDLAAIRELVGTGINQTVANSALEGDADADEEESERWDYDQLLELGQALGGLDLFSIQ